MLDVVVCGVGESGKDGVVDVPGGGVGIGESGALCRSDVCGGVGVIGGQLDLYSSSARCACSLVTSWWLCLLLVKISLR